MAQVAHWLQKRVTAVTPPGLVLPNVGAIGLELELEGDTHWPNVPGWRQETDGSLRNGIEYVFDGPQMGARAEASIAAMGSNLAVLDGLQPSFRCSTHVHVDVRDLEVDKVEKLVLAYMLVEPVLFDHCSMERRYSNFCTPMYINTNMTSMFSRLFHGQPNEANKVMNMNHWPKYSALNLKPMTEYGSVEFRGSHALTTQQELLDLSCRLLHVKRLAVESPDDQTFAQFIQHLRTMPLSQLFPSGLRDGYVPDEDQMDKCFGSTLAVLHRAPPGGGMSVPEMLRASARSRPEPSRDYYRGNVGIDPAVMERYNLFVPPRQQMEINSFIRMVVALRRIQGITRPNFQVLAPNWSEVMDSGTLVRTLQRAGVTPQDVGF